MKKIYFILIVFFITIPLFAEKIEEKDSAMVEFSARTGVDIGFSYSPMNNNIMPPLLSSNERIELTLEHNVWLSQPFYLHARVYVTQNVIISISTFPLCEYSIDLTGSQAGGYITNGKKLTWTNTAENATVFKGSVSESYFNLNPGTDILVEEDVNTDIMRPRYYSWPIRMQVLDSDSVGGGYYRTEFKVKVESI